MKLSLMPQLVDIRVVPLGGGTKPTGGRALADRKVILARVLSFFRCCFSLAGLFGWAHETLTKRSLLFCVVLCVFSLENALAQNVGPVGDKWVLISTTKNPNGPCGATKNVYFDGAISPFSYTGTSGQTVVQISASLGATNYRYLGSLVSGDLAPNYVVDCQGMYTALKSSDPTLFRWGEWLYGFYRSPATGYVYSTIYNEYYGGNYASGALQQNGCRVDHPEQCNYSGIGLARSTDNGRTFSPIQTAPNHVIARVPYLYYSNAGHGMGSAFEGGGTFFSNPNDDYLYRALNQFKNTPGGDYGVTMMRTRKQDIDDPTSWRVWDGAGYNTSFYPAGAYGVTVPTPFGSPFYLGWSAYFQTYIATGVCGPNYCFTFSSDMIHWSPGVTIMPIDPQAFAESGSGLPSLLDPAYLAQTGDGSAANGGIIGRDPYLTFIRQNVSPTIQQQVVVQRLHFDDPTPPVVSITTPITGAQLSGLQVQVSATASDNVRVVGVQFKLDGGNLGTEVTVPNQGLYSTTWNLTAAAGSHTLTAVARDGAGNTMISAEVAVTVLLTGTISASPNPCVIPVGGTQCTTFISWTTSPSLPQTAHVRANYGGPIPTTVVVGCGPNSLVPIAVPISGGTVNFTLNYVPACNVFPFFNTTLASVNVTATSPPDTTPPVVAITAPSNGDSVRGVPAVYGTASDNVGVAGVQFKLDCPGPNCVNIGNEVLNPAATFAVRWITSLTANGPHTLTAVARDAAGNTTTSSPPISVTVDNAAPTVAITSPANGVMVAGIVTVSGTASDNIGVVSVQFLLDDAPLQLDTSFPYSASWNTYLSTSGNHTLKAQARDAAGNITTSSPVIVTVNNGS
jgi:hypothetical protein